MSATPTRPEAAILNMKAIKDAYSLSDLYTGSPAEQMDRLEKDVSAVLSWMGWLEDEVIARDPARA